MRLRSLASLALLVLLVSFASALPALAQVPAGPTKMLTQPALSADRVAFVYGNDVWTSRLDGSGVQRITSGPGTKTSPAFSPDGSLLAFSAELDGNVDVFVVPAVGGVPKRLTWHPGRDVVQGFTPDGKAVLFSSPREAFENRHTQLYTVPVEGGVETKLPIPNADRAVFSPDGKTIAYTPNRPAHLQWKRYRGGTRLADLALRRRDARRREGPAARGALQRPQPRVGRRNALPHVGPRRRVQRLRVRPEGDEDAGEGDEPRRLPRPQRRLCAPGRSSTSRPASFISSTRERRGPRRSRSRSPATSSRLAPAGRRERSGSATPRSHPRAPASRSSSGARS